MVPLAQAKLKTLLLLRDIEGVSNCCLPQRFIFLGVVCHLFRSLSSALLHGQGQPAPQVLLWFGPEKEVGGGQGSGTVLSGSFSDLSILFQFLCQIRLLIDPYPQCLKGLEWIDCNWRLL